MCLPSVHRPVGQLGDVSGINSISTSCTSNHKNCTAQGPLTWHVSSLIRRLCCNLCCYELPQHWCCGRCLSVYWPSVCLFVCQTVFQPSVGANTHADKSLPCFCLITYQAFPLFHTSSGKKIWCFTSKTSWAFENSNPLKSSPGSHSQSVDDSLF